MRTRQITTSHMISMCDLSQAALPSGRMQPRLIQLAAEAARDHRVPWHVQPAVLDALASAYKLAGAKEPPPAISA